LGASSSRSRRPSSARSWFAFITTYCAGCPRSFRPCLNPLSASVSPRQSTMAIFRSLAPAEGATTPRPTRASSTRRPLTPRLIMPFTFLVDRLSFERGRVHLVAGQDLLDEPLLVEHPERLVELIDQLLVGELLREPDVVLQGLLPPRVPHVGDVEFLDDVVSHVAVGEHRLHPARRELLERRLVARRHIDRDVFDLALDLVECRGCVRGAIDAHGVSFHIAVLLEHERVVVADEEPVLTVQDSR